MLFCHFCTKLTIHHLSLSQWLQSSSTKLVSSLSFALCLDALGTSDERLQLIAGIFVCDRVFVRYREYDDVVVVTARQPHSSAAASTVYDTFAAASQSVALRGALGVQRIAVFANATWPHGIVCDRMCVWWWWCVRVCVIALYRTNTEPFARRGVFAATLTDDRRRASVPASSSEYESPRFAVGDAIETK
jgi:hypothetical protein